MMPAYSDHDLRTIQQPLDFYGTNIYDAVVIRAGADGAPVKIPPTAGRPLTFPAWGVRPTSMYWGPRFLYERYGRPIAITENGMSNMDWVALDGCVHDPQRIDFLHRHLREFGRAIQDGVDGRAYFTWTLMDNFEWADGFKQRFGLVHVDYQTLKRTMKDSASWYAGVIRAHGATL
jgi:beta-glucosidase